MFQHCQHCSPLCHSCPRQTWLICRASQCLPSVCFICWKCFSLPLPSRNPAFLQGCSDLISSPRNCGWLPRHSIRFTISHVGALNALVLMFVNCLYFCLRTGKFLEVRTLVVFLSASPRCPTQKKWPVHGGVEKVRWICARRYAYTGCPPTHTHTCFSTQGGRSRHSGLHSHVTAAPTGSQILSSSLPWAASSSFRSTRGSLRETYRQIPAPSKSLGMSPHKAWIGTVIHSLIHAFSEHILSSDCGKVRG